MSLKDAAWIVYKAYDPASDVRGVIEYSISEGESISDLFIISDEYPLHVRTTMIYKDGNLQTLTNTESEGDFYLEDGRIIANYDIPGGSTLAIAILTDISTYFSDE